MRGVPTKRANNVESIFMSFGVNVLSSLVGFAGKFLHGCVYGCHCKAIVWRHSSRVWYAGTKDIRYYKINTTAMIGKCRSELLICLTFCAATLRSYEVAVLGTNVRNFRCRFNVDIPSYYYKNQYKNIHCKDKTHEYEYTYLYNGNLYSWMHIQLNRTEIDRYLDDVIKWKHSPRNWPFVRGIHRSPVNSPHKGQCA